MTWIIEERPKAIARYFVPVGACVINLKEILAAKNIAGMKYMIVEQHLTYKILMSQLFSN